MTEVGVDIVTAIVFTQSYITARLLMDKGVNIKLPLDDLEDWQR